MWGLLPRSTQITIIVLLVVCAGWVVSAVSWFFTGTPISPLKSTSLVATIIGVAVVGAFGLCWRWVWRLVPALNRWFPDLTGHWEGEYASSYERDGTKATGSFTAAIRQGLFNSTVTAWTGEMRSHSIRSWLEADRDAQRFTIGYTYRSTPNAVVRDRSPPHEGVCFLAMHPDSDPECLTGIYYTERRTIGDLKLKRVSMDRLFRVDLTLKTMIRYRSVLSNNISTKFKTLCNRNYNNPAR